MKGSNIGVKYDDWGWHIGGVFPAGQPEINGFTHIGMYLVWIVTHDLHNPEFFEPKQVAKIKAGETTSHDLADWTDGKLVDELMAPEGKAFSDWYYSTGDALYLRDWAKTFSAQPEYTVLDTPTNYERIRAKIDDRYRQWVQAGCLSEPPVAAFPSLRISRGRLVILCWLGMAIGAALAIGGVLLKPAGIQGLMVLLGGTLFVVSAVVLLRLDTGI